MGFDNERCQLWVGIDIGKGHHRATAVDHDAIQVWSSKIVSDEAAVALAISEVSTLADQLSWAVDVTSGPVGLLLAMLAHREQQVRTSPAGRSMQ